MQFTTILIQYPWAAGWISVAFLLLYHAKQRKVVWLTASAWLFYCFYEVLIYKRILCSGDCNIRIDLLLIYPILILLSFYSLAMTLKRN